MRLIIDIILTVLEWIKKFVFMVIEKFIEQNIYEKLITISFIPAFFAVAMPVARYYIFESYFYINNPLSVYLIGIVIIMLPLALLPALWSLLLRCFINVYYLFWVIYLHYSEGITKAPYELVWNYYLNIAVPILFIIFSVSSFIIYRER